MNAERHRAEYSAGRGPRPRVILSLFTAILVLLSAACAPPLRAAEQGPKAYLVKVSGMINETYAETAKRKVRTAIDRGAETVILELDTPGGTVTASTDLGDFLFTTDEVRTIAFINTEAWSGGTIVALACDEIYIQSQLGKMGDAAPVTAQGEMLPEKYQTAIRETMRNYARDKGYPLPLLDAMVTPEIEVFRVRRGEGSKWEYISGATWESMDDEEQNKVTERELIVPSGQLLSLSADDAVEHGLAKAAVRSRVGLYEELGLDSSEVEWLYLTASEKALTYLDAFSPLLISVGLILIFIELSNPGFGVPGILGVGSFALFFLIKTSLHYAGAFEIMLFVAGLALLAVELLLIPGFGWFGGVGILLMVAGLVLSLQQFTFPATGAEADVFLSNVAQVVGALAAAGLGIALAVRLLPSMPYLNRMVNRESLAGASVGSEAEKKEPGRQELVGCTGKTLTTLRPSGRADINGKLLDVVAEGAFIEKGREVQVVAVHGPRIIVAPVEEVQT